jgi:hypothetical protein
MGIMLLGSVPTPPEEPEVLDQDPVRQAENDGGNEGDPGERGTSNQEGDADRP